MIKPFISCILVILLLPGCEKTITPDIKDASPMVVIEGNITNAPGPYVVYISKSIRLSEPDHTEPLSHALAIVSDNAGNTDTLLEQEPGLYVTHAIAGIPGRTYTLHVLAEGQDFWATSTMPQPVPMLGLYAQPDASTRSGHLLIPVYNDPAAAGNHYRFKAYENHVPLDFIRVRSDINTNGTAVSLPLRFDNYFNTGDTATLYMMCIDEKVYDYFYGLNLISGNGHMQPAAPANPVSNITGGCLGYFSAHTIQGITVVIP